MWSQPVSDYLWVAGGAILTLGLGAALLYWIDQEWHALDRQRRGLGAPPAHPGDNRPEQPPGDSSTLSK